MWSSWGFFFHLRHLPPAPSGGSDSASTRDPRRWPCSTWCPATLPASSVPRRWATMTRWSCSVPRALLRWCVGLPSLAEMYRLLLDFALYIKRGGSLFRLNSYDGRLHRLALRWKILLGFHPLRQLICRDLLYSKEMAVVFKTNDDAVTFKVPQASAEACFVFN